MSESQPHPIENQFGSQNATAFIIILKKGLFIKPR